LNALTITKHFIRPSRLLADWPKRFMFSAGGILALGGISKLLGIVGKSQQLAISDPIVGIQFRYILLAIGMAELSIAGLCLFTNKRKLSLGLLAWLVANYAVYRIGLWSMGWHHPYVLLGNLIETLNISPLMADGLVALSSAFLLIGSLTILWFGKGDQIPLPNNTVESLKMSCPACGIHIRFDGRNLGQNISCPHCKSDITLRKPDLLKMTCFFCKEHIEFPAHAIGEKIPCPHCKMDITLKEQT
jgi:predicted RNA-binding Zn-ribbon protein involved in translation (DUF1610 family)